MTRLLEHAAAVIVAVLITTGTFVTVVHVPAAPAAATAPMLA